MADMLMSFLNHFMCFVFGSVLTCLYLGFKILQRRKEVNLMKSQYRDMLHNKQMNHELQIMCDEFKRMIKTEEGALFFIDMMHLWLDRKNTSDTEK